MNGYPSCCSCEIATDDFDRAVLGSSWEQQAGTWSITGNQLTTSTTGRVIFSSSHPEGAGSAQITFDATASVSGGAVRGVVASDSTDDFIYVEWTFGSSCTSLRFYQVADGTTAQLGETRTLPAMSPGTFYSFAVCYSGGSYPASVGEVVGVVTIGEEIIRFTEAVASAAAGDQVGLGTGSMGGGTATFDNFIWNDHAENKGSCPDCKGGCDIIDEDFDASLACNWDESSGTWSVSGGEVSTSDSSARLISYRENVEAGFDHVYAEFSGSEGDEISILVDYKSATEFHRVTVTIGDIHGLGGEFRIYKGATLIKTQDTGDGARENQTQFIRVCLVGNLIEVQVGTPGTPEVTVQGAIIASTLYGGRGLAIGTETAAEPLSFHRVTWSRGKSPAGPDCPDCITIETGCDNCIDGDTPGHLKVVISGMSPGGAEYDSSTAEYNRTGCSDLEDNTDCPDINGTYILPQNPPFSSNRCVYFIVPTPNLCDTTTWPGGVPRPLGISVTIQSGELVASIFNLGGASFVYGTTYCNYGYWVNYRAAVASPLDCLSITGLTLSPFRVSDQDIDPYYNQCIVPWPCGWEGSSITVSAI